LSRISSFLARKAKATTCRQRRNAVGRKAQIKGTRFVLPRNPWNLTPKQNRLLSGLVLSNHPLARAWNLKEDFQWFWEYLHETWACRHVERSLWWASHSRVWPFKQFARLSGQHKDGILVWTGPGASKSTHKSWPSMPTYSRSQEATRCIKEEAVS
jgi:transposase